MGVSAWGDDLGWNSLRDPGVYLLAAAVADDADVAGLRAAMTGLRLGSSRNKLHWADESSTRRRQVVDVIASLPVDGFVIVRQSAPTERPERRRRKCLQRLLSVLTGLACDGLVLESRGPADDRRDRELLDRLRRSRTLSSSLDMSHSPGPADPMLWIADAFCGAVTQDRVGMPHYLNVLSARVRVEVI